MFDKNYLIKYIFPIPIKHLSVQNLITVNMKEYSFLLSLTNHQKVFLNDNTNNFVSKIKKICLKYKSVSLIIRPKSIGLSSYCEKVINVSAYVYEVASIRQQMSLQNPNTYDNNLFFLNYFTTIIVLIYYICFK